MSYQEVAEAVEPCQEEASFLYREMTRQREVRWKKGAHKMILNIHPPADIMKN